METITMSSASDLVFGGNIGRMENKMETIIGLGLRV